MLSRTDRPVRATICGSHIHSLPDSGVGPPEWSGAACAAVGGRLHLSAGGHEDSTVAIAESDWIPRSLCGRSLRGRPLPADYGLTLGGEFVVPR